MSCNKGCSKPLETKSCPMWMADGRVTTDYKPRCAVNEELNSILTNNNKQVSSYNIRMYLQQNAEKEMERQRKNSLRDVADCVPCSNIVNKDIVHPERYVVSCNAVSCSRNEVNSKGLGDGRNY